MDAVGLKPLEGMKYNDLNRRACGRPKGPRLSFKGFQSFRRFLLL